MRPLSGYTCEIMKIVRFGNRYVDLHAPADCARASPIALQLFFELMRRWEIDDAQARILLGNCDVERFQRLRADPAGESLQSSSLKRIAFMLAIWRDLSQLYGPGIADDWVQLPNSHHMFCRVTPLNFMLLGGTQAMKNIHRLLARRCESADSAEATEAAAPAPQSIDRAPG